ncbi:MAG TPA: helicase, partial [Firmicutes bacterium]|nr:helicase [Bacillota bacterium]
MSTNFITNARQRTLKGRIHALIKHSQELKFLVGFFYFSGWRELYEALRSRDDLTLKILVGLDTDVYLGKVLEVADPNADRCTQTELVESFFGSLRTALRDETLDTQEFYEQVAFFIRLLENGRLHIRKTLEPNHAKLYLFRLDEE